MVRSASREGASTADTSRLRCAWRVGRMFGNDEPRDAVPNPQQICRAFDERGSARVVVQSFSWCGWFRWWRDALELGFARVLVPRPAPPTGPPLLHRIKDICIELPRLVHVESLAVEIARWLVRGGVQARKCLWFFGEERRLGTAGCVDDRVGFRVCECAGLLDIDPD